MLKLPLTFVLNQIIFEEKNLLRMNKQTRVLKQLVRSNWPKNLETYELISSFFRESIA